MHRVREGERRERLKREREEREKREREDEEISADIKRRIAEGDLRERVVERVVSLIKSDSVALRVTKRADELIAARRAEVLGPIESARAARIAAARAETERTLTEARELEDILAENARKVKAESARVAEATRVRQRERAAELALLSAERSRSL